MPPNHLHDPMTHFGAMLDQLVRQNQTLISFIDRIVTAQHETTVDLRTYRRTTEKAVEGLEERIEVRFATLRQDTVVVRGEIASVRGEITDLRSEMNGRFRAVGLRFDELDAKTDRIERTALEFRQDMLRLENGLLNAQQSALQANLRHDEGGSGASSPPGA